MPPRAYNKKIIEKYFNFINDQAVCKICSHVLKGDRSFNLKIHLKKIHKIQEEQEESTPTHKQIRKEVNKVEEEEEEEEEEDEEEEEEEEMTLNATEANCLKSLLNSWELGDLFELLKAEEISIEVLQIMQRHHLAILLRNQTLGVRIRFEHNFERWRQMIRKPLEASTATHEPQIRPTNTKNIEKSTRKSFASFQNSSSSGNNINLTNTAEETLRTTAPRPFISNTARHRQTLDERSLILKPNVSVAEEKATSNSNAKYQHINIEKQSKDPGITVLKILYESGSKGESLLQAYEEQQTFTQLQRTLLISLIVAHFGMKNYHLSLNTSQILEKQILELFPTEKVEYYRGKKKSKIYMKYNNVKRRDTDFFPSKKRARTTSNSMDDAENSNSDIEIISPNKILNEKEIEGIRSNENSKIDEQLNEYLIKNEYFSD